MKRLFHSSLFLCFIVTLALLVNATGCANIIPPTGGARDSLPPFLVTALPKDSTLNFNEKKIVLTFNEYVQLDNNINENIVVSPNPDNQPILENKLRTVTVKLKDSLKPNTTYAINFGNGIQDVNEKILSETLLMFSPLAVRLPTGIIRQGDNGRNRCGRFYFDRNALPQP